MPMTLFENPIELLNKQTHRAIFGLVPIGDGDMVVGHFTRDQFLGLGLPEYGVEIGEVMVNVYSIIAPSPQRPAIELRTLEGKYNEKEKQEESHGSGGSRFTKRFSFSAPAER